MRGFTNRERSGRTDKDIWLRSLEETHQGKSERETVRNNIRTASPACISASEKWTTLPIGPWI